MNKKPDEMKKYKRFCTRADWNFFQKMFIINCAFLNVIIILIKENKKKLTLCQRNEQTLQEINLNVCEEYKTEREA